jgi:hypothetical protein
MDAKAENTETASAAEATPEAGTETGNAVRTLEERLRAGLTRELGEPPSDAKAMEDKPKEDKPLETEDTSHSDAATKEDKTEEDGEIKDGEVEGLNAKAQAKINERIHELNIKRKNAEAKTEQLETQFNDLNKKVQDENVQAVMKMGLDPEYITPDEAKILKRFEVLREWKRWCRTHRTGYEGSGTKEDPSMTEAEVADQEARIEDELLDIGGTARALWVERTKQMLEDMTAGRKLRLEKAKKPAGKPADPQPPRLPAGTGASRKPLVSAGSKVKTGFDDKEFKEAGADKSALEKQFEKIFGG